jgi:hypothetical protein
LSAALEQGPPRAELAALLARLRAAGTRLVARPVDEVLAALDRVVEAWLDPASPWRLAAEDRLPVASGFSPPMVRFGLRQMLEPLRGDAIGRLLDAELGSRYVLDRPHTGRLARRPRLLAHVVAGNLPGHAFAAVLLGLAIKTPVFLKPAGTDHVVPDLLGDSLRAVDERLAECFAAAYWPGGDAAREDVVFSAADLVVASGADATMADIRRRCRSRLVEHGHRVSVALVGGEMLEDDTERRRLAAGLAMDIALWDQRGCLSPQTVWVEGAIERVEALAADLNDALAGLARSLPPGEASEEEVLAVQQWRQEAEWKGLGGAPSRCLTGSTLLGGTVVVDAEPAFRPSPIGRCVRLSAVTSLAVAFEELSRVGPVLEAAGVGVGGARWEWIVRGLADVGVHRVCRIGDMQRPPLAWPQGGRPRVGDWVSWCGVEDG